MSEPTCQWCGAGVKKRFCQPESDIIQMILFRCDVEYYPQESEAAWPRRPTLKCGQRCAEQMRQLRQVRDSLVQLAIDSVTKRT